MEKQEELKTDLQGEPKAVENSLSTRLKEKHGKNISLRLKDDERQRFDSFAKSLGMTRTEMIRRAVRYFEKHSAKEKESVVKAAENLMAMKTGSADYDQVIKHSLTKKIYGDGLEIKDDKGNTITRIKNLHSLMEFLDTKVFY